MIGVLVLRPSLPVRAQMLISMYLCVCVCVYVYTQMLICMCVCVCVCIQGADGSRPRPIMIAPHAQSKSGAADDNMGASDGEDPVVATGMQDDEEPEPPSAGTFCERHAVCWLRARAGGSESCT